MNKCTSWHEADPAQTIGSGRCFGTKECDPCDCGGDEAKCDFYPKKRQKAAVMKTPEEIKAGLRHCSTHELCEGCPIACKCTGLIIADALALIEQLEGQIALMKEQMAGDCGVCKHKREDAGRCYDCLLDKDRSHPLWEYEGLPEVESV